MNRTAAGVLPAKIAEASLLELLHSEIGKNFEPDVCERMGNEIGFRFVARLPSGPPPYSVPLDILKFFCKDVWLELYGKKVDRLQTNHKGTFMCTDNAFLPLAKLKRASASDIERFLAIHKGMIRGGLINLGVTVTEMTIQILGSGADSHNPLGCCFTIKTS